MPARTAVAGHVDEAFLVSRVQHWCRSPAARGDVDRGDWVQEMRADALPLLFAVAARGRPVYGIRADVQALGVGWIHDEWRDGRGGRFWPEHEREMRATVGALGDLRVQETAVDHARVVGVDDRGSSVAAQDLLPVRGSRELHHP